jgi:autotransporter-associated beta strand protein
MTNHRFLLKGISLCLMVGGSAYASSIQWIGQSSNNMQNPTNWSTDTVPTISDDVVFDSTYTGVNRNPSDASIEFSISTFAFPNSASAFNFHFNNGTLTFNGDGITGFNTDPTLNIINTDNGVFVGDLLYFLGSSGGSLGSASITSSNIVNPGTIGGYISSHLHSVHPFTITDGGSISANNTGNSNDSGAGGQTIASSGTNQLQFDASLTVGNDVTISVLNSGTFNGNTSSRDRVGVVNNSQFLSVGTFEAGNNFSCTVQNLGNDSAQGTGDNYIGVVNNQQMALMGSATVGNGCEIIVSNAGYNDSQITGFSEFVGYLNEQQFIVVGALQAGNDFHLTVSNTGVDVSSGRGGGQVGAISTNSMDGQQVWLRQGGIIGDNAVIHVTNSGTYSGTNSAVSHPSIGLLNAQQIAIGDYSAIGSYSFSAGSGFTLNVSNEGIDSAVGHGSDAVGDVAAQVALFAPCSLGNNANITISNYGNYSGEATEYYVDIGSIGVGQLDVQSSFEVGDHFTLNITNLGMNACSGTQGNFVGDIIGGLQAHFNAGLIVGDDAHINISNRGVLSATVGGGYTGNLLGNAKQLLVQQLFQAGNNFQLVISNSGVDSSAGEGGNYVGFQNNSGVPGSGSQVHLMNGGLVGTQASIVLSNTGTCEGSNAGLNRVGVLAGQQFCSVGAFQAGNDFSLTVVNEGINNTSGQNNNGIGTAGYSQVEFSDACALGDNVSLVISNSGINHDTSGTGNLIGFSGGSQLYVQGDFVAGVNLNVDVTNTSINVGDESNTVGHVSGSQILFGSICTLGDGAMISAFNSGTVSQDQIVFNGGFSLAGGKATVQSINRGAVVSSGIYVAGNNVGGDVNVILGNSSLYADTTGDAFTIGALNGDATSVAQSSAPLVINTDQSVVATFAGIIQDFSSTSTLTKIGPGTQKLSGINTYTGLTAIEEGILVINGSLAGDALIDFAGTLKGNGTIHGLVTNAGVISPGESIGTLTVNTYISNNGNYDVEVNGNGQSDLIHVLETATLNGGMVFVSSVDDNFVFQQPYTILVADGVLTGAFSGTDSSVFISSTLAYGPDSVSLTIAPDLLRAAEACNQYGVASNLDEIPFPNSEQNLLISAIAVSPLKEAQASLESLSGFQYTNDVWANQVATRRFLRRLYDPLRPLVISCNSGSICDPACSDWSTWLETGYGFTELWGDNAHKSLINSYQVTGGVQKSFCTDLTVGLAGSYEYDHTNYKDAKGDRNSEFASLYGLYRPSILYGFVDLVYGHASSNVRRSIYARDLHYKAIGKPELNTFALYSEIGPDIDTKHLLIQPFFGIEYERNWRKRIYESQANGWGLSINSKDWSSTSSRLGVHLSSCKIGDCVDLSLDVAWNQLLSSRQNSTTGHFEQFGDTFQICGNHLDNYSIDYALTLLTCFSKGLKGYFELGGESWKHAYTVNAIAGVEFSW